MKLYATTRLAVLLTAIATSLSGCAGVVVGAAAAGAVVATDRRTGGSIVEDQAIETKANSALRNDPEIYKQTHLNVISYNQAVLITGEAPNEELRERAEHIVAGVEKVRKVYNEIIIAAPSAISARSSDAWITTTVKTSLLQVDALGHDPTLVKVVTERGVVYLMGIVSRAEADAVTEQVRRESGVQRVVRLFEYTD